MSSEVLSSEDVEAADVLWGLQDLPTAADCLNLRRRLIHLQWGCKKKRSTKRIGRKGERRRERISPTTPLLFNPIINPILNSLTNFQNMSPHSQSVEEAKRQYEMEIAMKQQEEQEQPDQQTVLDLFHVGPLQQRQRRRPALDLNRSPPAEEAMLAWQLRKALSTQARKRRKLLMKAKSSSKIGCEQDELTFFPLLNI